MACQKSVAANDQTQWNSQYASGFSLNYRADKRLPSPSCFISQGARQGKESSFFFFS